MPMAQVEVAAAIRFRRTARRTIVFRRSVASSAAVNYPLEIVDPWHSPIGHGRTDRPTPSPLYALAVTDSAVTDVHRVLAPRIQAVKVDAALSSALEDVSRIRRLSCIGARLHSVRLSDICLCAVQVPARSFAHISPLRQVWLGLASFRFSLSRYGLS